MPIISSDSNYKSILITARVRVNPATFTLCVLSYIASNLTLLQPRGGLGMGTGWDGDRLGMGIWHGMGWDGMG